MGDTSLEDLRRIVDLNFGLLRAMRTELERLYETREELHGADDLRTEATLTRAIAHSFQQIEAAEEQFHDELLQRLERFAGG
jgi:hypothetical protein